MNDDKDTLITPVIPSATLVCENCFLNKRCLYCGNSPMELEEGEFTCEIAGEYRGRIGVMIPRFMIVNANNGKTTGVMVEIVYIRKSWWARLFKRSKSG